MDKPCPIIEHNRIRLVAWTMTHLQSSSVQCWYCLAYNKIFRTIVSFKSDWSNCHSSNLFLPVIFTTKCIRLLSRVVVVTETPRSNVSCFGCDWRVLLLCRTVLTITQSSGTVVALFKPQFPIIPPIKGTFCFNFAGMLWTMNLPDAKISLGSPSCSCLDGVIMLTLVEQYLLKCFSFAFGYD